MPDKAPSPHDSLVVAHETRIQNMEEVSRETATVLGQHTARLDELGTKIDTAVLTIGQKIEEAVIPLAEDVKKVQDSLNQKTDNLERALSEKANRIKDLEGDKAERDRIKTEILDKQKARNAKISAILWSAVGAGVVVFVKDILPGLLKNWHLIS